jgi:hypothetical protein
VGALVAVAAKVSGWMSPAEKAAATDPEPAEAAGVTMLAVGLATAVVVVFSRPERILVPEV